MRGLIKYFDIQKGLTAVIGGGGKTALMKRLSEELTGSIILTTTTHIFPCEGIPLYTGSDENELRGLLLSENVLCVGNEEGVKLTAPKLPLEVLKSAVEYVLVEADGAAGRPLKAHASWEPVIPQEANQIILVIGASGFGMNVDEAVHRYEIFVSEVGAFILDESNAVSPECYALYVASEMRRYEEYLECGCRMSIFINQVETAGRLDRARLFAEAFSREYGDRSIPVIAGSLRENRYSALCGRISE